MAKKLRDIAKVIRSKNAGALQFTMDVMFEDEATYDVLLAPMGVTADGRPVPHIAQNAFAAAAALSEPLRSVPAG